MGPRRPVWMLQEEDFVADELNEDAAPTPTTSGEPEPGSSEEVAADTKTASIAGKRPVIKKRRSRKDRHEDLAQPDEFVEVGGTIVDWLIDRRKVVGIVMGGMLLVLLAGGIHGKLDSGKQAEASAALFQARELLPSTSTTPLSGGLSFDLPSDLDDEARRSKVEAAVVGFEGVLSDFGGTPQADQARVLAGKALFGIGEYERALVFVEPGVKAGGVVGERAQDVRGFTLLALDRAPEAVTVFSNLRDNTKGASRARATLNLGVAHEAAGDSEAARGVYTLFEEEFPDSDLLSEVQSRAGANASSSP